MLRGDWAGVYTLARVAHNGRSIMRRASMRLNMRKKLNRVLQRKNQAARQIVFEG